MTYHLAIGDRIYSSWSLRGWLLFAKFEIPVHIHSSFMYSPEFTKMLEDFGNGRLVPAIRIEDADTTVYVSDTLAIAETLNERHPEKNMWPKEATARGLARSIVAEMHTGFGALRSDCAMNLRHRFIGFSPSEAVLADLTRLETIWRAARKFAKNGPWLFGEYSIADAFFAPVASRMATYQLPVGPVSAAYIETTLKDPAFAIWRNAGLAENYIQPGYDLDLETTRWPSV